MKKKSCPVVMKSSWRSNTSTNSNSNGSRSSWRTKSNSSRSRSSSNNSVFSFNDALQDIARRLRALDTHRHLTHDEAISLLRQHVNRHKLRAVRNAPRPHTAGTIAWNSVGTKKGTGNFGSVRIATAARIKAFLKPLKRHMDPVVVTRPLPFNGATRLAIKHAIFDPQSETFAEFMARCLNEYLVQQFLGRPASRAKAHVPKVYLGGFVGTEFFSVMEVAPGKTLDETRVTPAAYTRIVDAYQTLVQEGVHHGDLNAGNVVYDTSTGRVTFIDFGSAVKYRGSRPAFPIINAISQSRGQSPWNNRNALERLKLYTDPPVPYRR